MAGKLDLDRIKREVDLVAVATGWYGYVEVRRKSGARQLVLRHPDRGDQLVVQRSTRDGIPRYFNPQDDADRGTVIDLLLYRENGDWEQVQQQLLGFQRGLQWGHAPEPAPPRVAAFDLLPLRDRRFLHQRGLSDATLDHPWFQGRVGHWANHGHLNTAFPLYQGKTIVGLSLRNHDFKGYAPGSRKQAGCWFSDLQAVRAPIDALLLTESALDALAFHQLHPPRADEQRVYLSTGGRCAPGQYSLIQLLIDSLQPQQVWLGGDRDGSGQLQNLALALRLSHPQGTPAPVQGLAERLGEGRIRLTLQIAQTDPLVVQATRLLLSGFAEQGAALTEAENAWLLDLPQEAELLSQAVKLVLHLRRSADWMRLRLPQGKDWNEDLLQGDTR